MQLKCREAYHTVVPPVHPARVAVAAVLAWLTEKSVSGLVANVSRFNNMHTVKNVKNGTEK